MTDDTVTPPIPDCNEDYTGAVCLLVRAHWRRRKHLRIEALVDADRLDEIAHYKWNMSKGYVVCTSPLPGTSGWALGLHRFLTDPPEGMVVDHKNRRRADNRMKNLRVCTHQENMWNTPPITGCSSRHKGVRREGLKRGSGRKKWEWSRWKASIRKDDLIYFIGTFDDEDHAAYAYNIFATQFFGEFAYLNEVSLTTAEVEQVHKVIASLEKKRRQRLLPKPVPQRRPKPRIIYACDLVDPNFE